MNTKDDNLVPQLIGNELGRSLDLFSKWSLNLDASVIAPAPFPKPQNLYVRLAELLMRFR
jgi:hypothetical protein